MNEPRALADEWETLFAAHDKADMARTLGIKPLPDIGDEVRLVMPWTEEISQPAGLFSAAALFGLADIAATFLAMRHTHNGQFALAIQANVRLIANVAHGSATATASLVKAGRTLIHTDTIVTAEDGRLLASVQGVFLNPAETR